MTLDLKTGFLIQGIKWAVSDENNDETYVHTSFWLAGHLLTMTHDLELILTQNPRPKTMGPQDKNKNKYDSMTLLYDLIQQSQEGNKDQLLHSVLWHA